MRKLSALILILLITVFAFNSCAKKETGPVQVEDFSLTLIDEGTWNLSDYKNKPIFIAFMAPHCPYCKMSTDMINNMHKISSKKGLQLIVIFTNSDLEEVQEFVHTARMKSKASYGSKEVARKFKIRGYPYFFLLDKNHVIHEYWIGYHESYDEEILTEINAVL